MDIVSTDPNRPGIFAFGQVAVGVIAFGQLAVGVIAIGQLARGVLCVGQGAIGVACVGQGAIGLYHATGMVGLAGPRGYGIVLHLLPRLAREPLPPLPAETPIDDLLERREERGWVDARLRDAGGGQPKVELAGGQAVRLDQVEGRLKEALADGRDRVRLRLSVESVVDASGYRAADTHVELVAEEFIAYRGTPPAYLTYGTIPKGAPGARATGAAIVARSICYLTVVYLVYAIALGPVAGAIFGAHMPLALPAF